MGFCDVDFEEVVNYVDWIDEVVCYFDCLKKIVCSVYEVEVVFFFCDR